MLRILIASIVLLLSASLAQAAVCTVQVSDVDFGTVDTVGNTPATSTADVAIGCSGITEGVDTITMCGNIGAGDGGQVGGLRQSVAGAGKLGFGLYTASDYSVPWGSIDTPTLGAPHEIDVPVSGSSATFTAHIYAVVPRGQLTTPVGQYSANLSESDVDFKYAEGPLDCVSPGGADEATASFTVSASVLANCLLQTADLDFGTAGLIGHNIDAATSMGITCTPGTGYAITIDGGGSGDPTHRLMHSGGNNVSYSLYSDPSRSLPWGTAPSATVSGTGDGSKAQLGVYGRIPPQSAERGSYGDTVVVTVNY